MTITDKTRKKLWARSGNQCALCRTELIMPSTPIDDDSVIGDECHIVSGRATGPRFDPNFRADQIDSYDNLILLCKTHHKLIDDQSQLFTTELLSSFKQEHEARIADLLRADKMLLSESQDGGLILERVRTGRELLNIVINVYGYDFSHDEPNDEYEAEQIAAFLQTAQDLGECGDVIEAGDRVREGYRLTQAIREIEHLGFRLFGKQYQWKRRINKTSELWPVAALHLVPRRRGR